eukprot:3935784-Rhodomonas_salina.1
MVQQSHTHTHTQTSKIHTGVGTHQEYSKKRKKKQSTDDEICQCGTETGAFVTQVVWRECIFGQLKSKTVVVTASINAWFLPGTRPRP